MKALIDYDIICYSSGFVTEKAYYDIFENDLLIRTFLFKKDALGWIAGEDGYTMQRRVVAEPVENALHIANLLISRILYRTGATTYIGYLTGKGNFRDEVAVTKPYKGNRDPNLKPVHYQAIRNHLIKHHNGTVVDGYEADDAMAIAQENLYYATKGSIICSIDKDMDQIIGPHYNWQKDNIYFVSPDTGKRMFYYQLLVGDRVDNIQGVPGIGPVNAKRLLDKAISERDMYLIAREEYQKYYKEQGDTVLREMADLLYIRRIAPDVGWNPPNENT